VASDRQKNQEEINPFSATKSLKENKESVGRVIGTSFPRRETGELIPDKQRRKERRRVGVQGKKKAACRRQMQGKKIGIN